MAQRTYETEITGLVPIDAYPDFIYDRITGVAEANQWDPHMQQLVDGARKTASKPRGSTGISSPLAGLRTYRVHECSSARRSGNDGNENAGWLWMERKNGDTLSVHASQKALLGTERAVPIFSQVVVFSRVREADTLPARRHFEIAEYWERSVPRESGMLRTSLPPVLFIRAAVP